MSFTYPYMDPEARGDGEIENGYGYECGCGEIFRPYWINYRTPSALGMNEEPGGGANAMTCGLTAPTFLMYSSTIQKGRGVWKRPWLT